MMLKRILITGANAGLGKETARQLAAHPQVEKIYLGCRNPAKASQAQSDLERDTGRRIFECLTVDVSDLDSVNRAVSALPEPVDALVMNAGGTGGKHFDRLTQSGVTEIFAVNLLGHAHLTEALIKTKKLTQVALYAGSEAARGVKEMGMKQPNLATSSVNEFSSIADGSFFGAVKDATIPYGPIKYMAAMWMSSMARAYPDIRFITMSPGATTGTEGFNSLTPVKQFVMKTMMRIMLALGKVHKLETGAQRFVDGLLNPSYQSGVFYASQRGLTGAVGPQHPLFGDLNNQSYQDNARSAINGFLPR